jgi:cystathionine gamma-synthase
MTNENEWKIETILAQGGNRSDDNNTGSIVTPINLSTAFRHPGLNESTGFDYSRLAGPTRSILESQLAKLESGHRAFATSSGMAAIDLVFRSFLESGDNFISSDDLYGGSFRYFDTLEKSGITYQTLAEFTEESLKSVINENTKLVWIETPSNPTMKIIDIEKVSKLVHAINPKIYVAVDNTFLTPILQNPLKLGADIVVHSATKYLGGHNDILAGVVITSNEDDSDIVEKQLTTTGQTLDGFSSWLLVRSLKTLHLRVAQHTKSAQYIAEKLAETTGVDKVLYPGIGGMISFYLSEEKSVDAFLRGLKVGSFAESLGGPETLITIPYVQTHHDMTVEARLELGITEHLIRVSVGLENQDDVLQDLQEAVKGA